MTIRPIDLNGMIQRTDDVGMIKRHEDAKPVLDQQNIQVQVNKREDQLSHVVIHADESDELHNNLDAKDEGRGGYHHNKAKKKDEKKQDKVIKKFESGSFDIKI